MLVWQGVPQTFDGPAGRDHAPGRQQTIALGPIASQEAIKELGNNGGGFVNANSAHPFENPTAPHQLAREVAILVIPFSLTVHLRRASG